MAEFETERLVSKKRRLTRAQDGDGATEKLKPRKKAGTGDKGKKDKLKKEKTDGKSQNQVKSEMREEGPSRERSPDWTDEEKICLIEIMKPIWYAYKQVRKSEQEAITQGLKVAHKTVRCHQTHTSMYHNMTMTSTFLCSGKEIG